MSSIILGISAFYHDSAAALLVDGKIIAAAQEERFTRKKHDSSFPLNAIKYVLNEANCDLLKIQYVAFYDKPYLKFERLLETYHSFAPKGLKSYLKAIPIWIKEKIFLKKLIKDEMKSLGLVNFELFFPEHHLSHSASAFYPSPFENSAILTLDGVGEWATTTISKGIGNDIEILKEINFPHSLGLLYSAFTYYCGFRVNSGEYKLMGLAPYGNPDSEQTKYFEKIIIDELIDIKDDGSFLLNMKHFDYPVGFEMCNLAQWERIFKIPLRKPESELSKDYTNMAYAIQKVTEEVVMRLSKTAKEITSQKNLCLAGGVALNCVANGKLLKSGIFDKMWIQPASGDAGGAIGAALAVWHITLNQKRCIDENKDSMQGSYFGPEFSDSEILKYLKKYNSIFNYYESFNKLCEDVVELMDSGNVIGWFQGRMEFGPRALGNRSIIGDARNKEMQKKLNLKIKYRESFRPFAPSVMYEYLGDYFDMDEESPYMLLVADVIESRQNKKPKNFEYLSLKEQLYFVRSDIPAITHLDYSARIQTVHKETNPKYWQLIETFRKKTGYAVIVNTSFNVRGEPIVCSPEDAYRCFMRTEMDYLVVGNFLLSKVEQPDWTEKDKWQEEFKLD